jgi:hypothetical protein
MKCLLLIEPKNQIMKRNLLQILSLALMLALLVPAMTYGQAGKANFAGTWAYNAEKSDQPQGGGGGGGGMRMGGGNMTVKQEANLLTIERTRQGQDGQPVTTTEKCTLDGKETVNSTQRGESKSTASWSADGKTLTIVTTRDFNGNTMTTKAAWALGEGNTLVVTTTSGTQDGGTRTMKAVYDKK